MDRKTHAAVLRITRKIHRFTGALLFFVFVIIAITGLLLIWKKNSAGLILPDTARGISQNTNAWISLDSLQSIANHTITEKLGSSYTLDRIDVRPDKGIAKFLYKETYWSVQLDGKNGTVLSVEKRNHDLIEDIHDGVIADKFFGVKGEIFKLIYGSVAGLALLMFSITGFWLWYGPKIMRKQTY